SRRDLLRQQIPVLEPSVVRVPFDVKINPSGPFQPLSLSHALLLLRSEGLRARFGRKSKNTQPGKNRHESYSHQDHVWEATGIKRGPSTSDGNRKARPWDACTALGVRPTS